MLTPEERTTDGSDLPFVSVVICTRNRGDKIVSTVASILANDYPAYELLIIDQSTTDETRRALEPFLLDRRLRYIASDDIGVARSRNRALVESRSELILSTDDDCVVDARWIGANVRALLDAGPPAIVFGDVVAAHDDVPGYIPDSVADRDFVVTSVRSWKPTDGVNVGIGASMAMRRSVMLDVGGFDEQLGPGSALKNAEDTDLSLRTVLAGHTVVHTRAARVTHYGSRPHDEFRVLTRGTMLGVGALSAKLLRSHPAPMAWFIAGLYWRLVIRPIPYHLLRREKPPVLGRATHLTAGLWRGLRAPVDPRTNRFAPPGARGA